MDTKKIDQYIGQWKKMGYSEDIPDEAPDELMRLGLAPSYKQIALCILQNDWQFIGLGFSAPYSKWYGVFKSIELRGRVTIDDQLLFNFD